MCVSFRRDPDPRSEHQRADIEAHLAEPFPASVEQVEVYGVVDPRLVDADIVGYVSRGRLDPIAGPTGPPLAGRP